MSTFLHRVIDSMLATDVPLEDQVLVLPSRRAITFFKSALTSYFDHPVFLPRLLTMDDLAREISGLGPLDQVSTALELYDSYCEVYNDAEPYEAFESWTGAILRDFNTIDTYLIDAAMVYKDLRLLKEINEWSFAAEELQGDQVAFNLFWQRLGALYARFNKRLSARGLSYSGAILRRASEEVVKKKVFPSFNRITFAGFNAISPAEVALFDQFHAEDRLYVLWDDAPFYRDNPIDPAGLFLRRWAAKDWSQTFGSNPQEAIELHLAAHPNAISQVTWAGSMLATTSTPFDRIALVLGDEKLLTPLLDRFPKELEHVNITIGISFSETTVFKFIAAFFRMHIAAERVIASGGEWALHYDELRKWTEMATHFGLLQKSFGALLESKIHEERIIFFTAKALDELLAEGQQAHFGLLPLTKADLLAAAVRQLKELKNKDKLITGVAQRMTELFYEVEQIIDQYAFIHRVDSLWKCIKGGLSRERISFVGEPLQGLQVMGLLETRALDFDEVILLGANEGALPKAQRFDSFLPYDLRRYYGLPAQQEEDAVFAYYFYRLFQGAKRLHIAYTSERDELGGGEQSRYLAQLAGGLPQKAGLKVNIQESTYSPLSREVPLPWVEVQKTAAVKQSILEWYTGRGVSFSRLSEYSRCPLDFYYRTVLGMGEQKEVEEELGSSDLGDIVHRVLELAYTPLKGKGILKQGDIRNLGKNYPILLQQVIADKGMEAMTTSGESALVMAVAKHMLKNFFLREEQRIEKEQVQVQALEEDWKMTRDLRIADEMYSIKFIAKIDRIERGEDAEVLIDFKTGRVKTEDVVMKEMTAESLFDAKKSKALQLIYYVWFYWRYTEGKLAKAGIISMVGLEAETHTLLLEGAALPSPEQLLRFEEYLFEHLAEIAGDGVFVHDTEQGFFCNYCIEKAERSW
jgi:RecB family exonuclease